MSARHSARVTSTVGDGSVASTGMDVRRINRRTAHQIALKIRDFAAHASQADQEYLWRKSLAYSGVITEEDEEEALDALRMCQKALELPLPPSRATYRSWFRGE